MNLHDILQAGAIGDAFGYQVEFNSLELIHMKYGSKGIEYVARDEICVSDDTQMTLFLLEAVQKYIEDNKYYDIKDFTDTAHDSFKEWYHTQNFRSTTIDKSGFLINRDEMYKRQAPGNTCLSALGHSRKRNLVFKINDSKGCGSVMRVAPLLKLKEHYGFNDKALFETAMEQAAITHGNEEGLSATGFFTLLLDKLAHGVSYSQAYQESLSITKEIRFNSFIEYIEKVHQKIQEPKLLQGDDLTTEIGHGWTADEAVGVAMYCFARSQDFKQCLELSTNHSGDSDSTASMAAQLFAAYHQTDNFLFTTDIDEIINIMLPKN